ncbi:hypothetical protein TDB9533_01207 [Thalassocella blandensis]|nr:hypothetical protein TDB9533_01207 [Thalassocella blandensis]
MKKITLDTILQHERQAIDREKRRRRLRGENRSTQEASNNDFYAQISNRNTVTFDERCEFTNSNINATLEPILSLRSKVESGEKVVLDFSKTVYCSAIFVVYLFSEIELLMNQYGQNTIDLNLYTLPDKLKRLFKGIGLLQLIKTRVSDNTSRRFLPVTRGINDQQLDDIISFVIDQARFKTDLSDQQRARVELLTSSAISEAMLNVQYHAYPTSEIDRYWWIMAAIIDGDLYIALCDRGVGIPSTLPYSSWWEQIMGALPINDDAQMIAAAMKYTRSSVIGKRGRGKGTRDIQKLVLEHKKGLLTIVSGKGLYRLNGAPYEEDRREEHFPLLYDISGTAINWRIPLED